MTTVSQSVFRQFHAFAAAVMLLVAAPFVGASTPDTAIPADSIYQLKLQLVDQSGRTFSLDEHKGHPLLVSMFYTSCQFVCPMLIDALQATQEKLSAQERSQLSVMMVSFDPAHDSVAALKRTADQRKLDPEHWTLARTDAKNVRKLAALLGIQYRALSNGEFNHTTALILIDAQGRITGRTAQLGSADAAFVKLVRSAASTGAN
jgi:protein SCO1/2